MGFRAFFETLKAPFRKKTVVVSNEPKTIWRNNMWVVTPDGLGIIFALKEPSEVHLVDEQGLTKAIGHYSTAVLRQAKYAEIPENRRGTVEKALGLGYT